MTERVDEMGLSCQVEVFEVDRSLETSEQINPREGDGKHLLFKNISLRHSTSVP